MAAPNYSPGVGKTGTTYTDQQGSTYRYDGTKWVQISGGMVRQSIPTVKTSIPSGSISSSSSGSSSNNYSNSLLSQFGGQVDKYVQDLIDFANEDYDFAAKWIEDQYKKAAGTDDQARKDFLKTVANTLEEKIGRVAYDYKTDSYRLQGKTDLALKRLDEDQRILTDQTVKQNAVDRGVQNSGLNARGIISGTRENATGLAGKEVGNLESNIADRMSALSRAADRNKTDILTANTQGQEDLTTNARRGAIDAGTQYNYGLESAQRTKEKAILNANKTKEQWQEYLANNEGKIA